MCAPQKIHQICFETSQTQFTCCQLTVKWLFRLFGSRFSKSISPSPDMTQNLSAVQDDSSRFNCRWNLESYMAPSILSLLFIKSLTAPDATLKVLKQKAIHWDARDPARPLLSWWNFFGAHTVVTTVLSCNASTPCTALSLATDVTSVVNVNLEGHSFNSEEYNCIFSHPALMRQWASTAESERSDDFVNIYSNRVYGPQELLIEDHPFKWPIFINCQRNWSSKRHVI